MSHIYLFVLGRTPDLAYKELQCFFSNAVRVAPDIVSVEHEALDAQLLIDQLGGTIKVARKLSTVDAPTAAILVGLLPSSEKDIHFGVSMYGASIPGSLLFDMKKLLEAKGIRSRYASARHGETLSSVTVDKQHLIELVVIKTKEGYIVGQTQAVQSYEAWGERDYKRPHADAKSGMLPPKVARMLVNIAKPPGQMDAPGVLLDPFCGMGTVLSEGYLAGWHVTGCDIVAEVVRKAQNNLAWIATQSYTGVGKIEKIFVSDAVHVSDTLAAESVAAIVTEPFMGATNIVNKPHAEPSDVKNIIKGLEKLYIGCLRDWAKILQKNGVVLIALPEYAVGGRAYFVKKVIDMCENLGYTIQDGPIEYSRPQATVRRKFYLLRKN